MKVMSGPSCRKKGRGTFVAWVEKWLCVYRWEHSGKVCLYLIEEPNWEVRWQIVSRKVGSVSLLGNWFLSMLANRLRMVRPSSAPAAQEKGRPLHLLYTPEPEFFRAST